MILRALQADHDGASATASKASPRTDGSGSRSATAARRREPSVLPRSTRPRKDSKPESSAGTCACASPSGRLWRPWVQALKSEAVGDDNARPGVVAVPQTFGSVLQPHPHLHALTSHGVWDQQGQWIPVPYVDTTPAEELFAHKIFRLLKTKGLLSDERMQLLLSFRHSGFSVDASPTVWPQDSHGLERLGRYLLRCPVSLSRIDWTPGSKTLFCQSKASHDEGERAPRRSPYLAPELVAGRDSPAERRASRPGQAQAGQALRPRRLHRRPGGEPDARTSRRARSDVSLHLPRPPDGGA